MSPKKETTPRKTNGWIPKMMGLGVKKINIGKKNVHGASVIFSE